MKKRKYLKIIICLTVIISAISLLGMTNVVNAETSERELLNVYKKMEHVLHISSGWLIDDWLRAFLWGLVQLLVLFNNFIESIVRNVILLNDFYESAGMKKIMRVVKPLVFGLFLISVVVLGIQFMLNKIEKRHEVIMNVMLAISMVVVIPVLMTESNKVLGYGIGWVQSGLENQTLAGGMVKSNVADIKYYAEKGFVTAGRSNNKYVGNRNTPPRPLNPNDSTVGTTEYKYANKLSTSKPSLQITEKLDLGKKKDKGGYKEWAEDIANKPKDVLKSKMIATGNGANKDVLELRDNQIIATDLGKETYYRYHVNWGVLISSLLVTSIALSITVIKIGRAIFDLAFHQIFGMFVASTDLTGGQRTKKVLVEIANTFGVIFVMVFILQMFIIYSNWVSGLKPDIGGFGVVLMLIAGAWALIDAPDIVQRTMGIDAGLRSGWQAMMGAYAGAKVAGGIGKGIGKGIGAVGKGARGLYSGGKGIARGITSKTSNENGKSGRNIQKNQEDVKPIPSIQSDDSLGAINKGNNIKPDNPQSPQSSSLQKNNTMKSGNSNKNNQNRTLETGNSKSKGTQGRSINGKDGYTSTDSGLLVPNSVVKGISETGQGLKSNEGLNTSFGNSSIEGNDSQLQLPMEFSMSPSSIRNNGGLSSKSFQDIAVGGQTGPINSSGSINGAQYSTTGQPLISKNDGNVGNVQHSTSGVQPVSNPSSNGPHKNIARNSGSGRLASDGSILPYGHKEPQYKNTLVGGMRSVRSMNRFATRAENTGFDVGQTIRKAGQATGKGMINVSRVVSHPVKATQYASKMGYTKTKQAIHSGSKNIKNGIQRAQSGIKNVVKQATTPLGETSKSLINQKKINVKDSGVKKRYEI